MNRRIPLWLTLVPLLAAAVVYWLFWTGWARDFEDMVADWLPGQALVASGFPYRLEIDVGNARLVTGEAVQVTATAVRARINRGPWQPQLTVVTANEPRLAAIVGPRVAVSIAGQSATTSIKVLEGKLARLSAVIGAARLRLGFAGVGIAADVLELHLRERVPGPAAADAGPTGAARGQVVVAGERLRLDGGDALTLAGDLVATGAGRLTAYDRWAAGGTIEATGFTLADAHGEVARATATLVPVGRTGVRYAGTILTVCPRNVVAALAGAPAVAEKRLRAAVRLAFEGADGDVRVTGLPDDVATRATRAQLPACPVVRGRRM